MVQGFSRTTARRVLMMVCTGDEVGGRSRGADLVAACGAMTMVVEDLICEKIARRVGSGVVRVSDW